MSINIYIDGFNLYYGALKNTVYKWLNISALCSTLFPGITINKIRYFTAPVKSTKHDPQAPIRQDIYLRALKTMPGIFITKGHFVHWPKRMYQFPLAYCNGISEPPQRVQIQKAEEKGSDVNIATYLLIDCFNNDFDEAIIISNDSDLALPIEKVVNAFGKVVRVVNPSRNKTAARLKVVATSYTRSINRKVLATCQFPPQLTDVNGIFNKPSTW